MKILRTYLTREFLIYFGISLTVLTFVMLLGNLIKFAYLIINKNVSIEIVGKLFIFLIPYLFAYTIPIAALSGVLLSLGRASSDNEIIAIKASGINIIKLLIPFIIIAFILSLTLVILNDQIIPKSHFASRKAIVDLGVKNPTAALEPGTFIDSFQKYILFIYRIEGNKLFNIRIYEPQGENKPTRTIVAKKGEFISYPDKGIVKLKLIEGTSDEVDPKNPDNFYKLYFKTYFMTLNLSQNQSSDNIDKKPKDMTIKELKNKINSFENKQIDPLPYLAQLHEKIAISFAPLVFMLLGIPLGMITHKRQKNMNMLLIFIIVVAYYLIFLGFEALSLQGKTPVYTMWLANIIMTVLGIILLRRSCAS
ncbi:MAG: LptF/LptG family permease [Candidatus Gygaella obscura]|nr:LptF/LptG family permease [Candidatus Gygaella obscura]